MYLKALWIIAAIVGVPAHPLSKPEHSVGAAAPPVAVLPVPPGSPTAQGSSDSKVLTGETINPGGSVSKTIQQGSSTGGSASGGGFNIGRTSSETQSLSNALGTSTSSDTDASSIQGASPGFHGFNANLGLPAGHQGVPAWPTHPGFAAIQTHPGFGLGFPTATGTSGSNVLTGETLNPDGSVSKTVQQGSSTGGSAAGGGINVGRTSSETQSVSNALGTSTSSDTDASSIQGASPGFHGFNANLGLPAGHQGVPAWPTHPGFAAIQTHPGFGFGSPTATGTSGSNVLTGETLNPDGSVSKTVQQGSSTGGSAAGGGINIGSTSSETQSVSNALGTSTSSDTDASSIQGASPGFHGFNANLGLPVGHQGVPAWPAHPGFPHMRSHPGFPSRQTHPSFGFRSPTAQGASDSKVLTGETLNPDGSVSKTVQQGSSTGGSAAGGGINVGRTSSETQSLSTPHETRTTSDTDASSIQGASPGFHGFNANLGFHAGQPHPGFSARQSHPGFPAIQTHPGVGFGSPTATGTSGSNVLTGETINPDGSVSKTVQQGSSTGGSAAGGGFNVGRTSSETQSVSNALGTSTSSDTDASSIQGASPGFHGFNANLGFPAGHQGVPAWPTHSGFPLRQPHPGFGFGSPTAQGASDSKVLTGETINPDGSVSKTVQQGSSTGGSAAGGGTNVGHTSSETESLNTPHETRTTSDTDASSIQGASPGFHGFSANLGLPAGQAHPGFPAIQTHPGFGLGFPTATGTSGSNILTGETINPDGSVSKTVQQGSSTGGSAAGGGINVGRTSSETQSVSNALGTSTSSDTDASSIQGASRGLHGFNANLGFPARHQGVPGWPTHPGFPHGQPHPSFGVGSPRAQGTSGSNVLTGETFNPDGSISKTVQQGSSTGGSAAGTGFNVGHTSSDTQSLSTPHETRTTSDTDASSIQGAGAIPGHVGFGHLAPLSAHPSSPFIGGPGFGSEFGSATGQADSALTRTEEQRPDGSTSKLTSLGSSAGGSAEGGGTSVSRSSGGTSSIQGAGGSQTQSHLESTSAQSGR